MPLEKVFVGKGHPEIEIESLVISVESSGVKIVVQYNALLELEAIPEKLLKVFHEEEVCISSALGLAYLPDSDWRWCCILCQVTVEENGIKSYGRDHLRCASYESPEEFLFSGDAESMAKAALSNSYRGEAEEKHYKLMDYLFANIQNSTKCGA